MKKEEPQPPVVAMAELTEMLGVSKSRAVQLIAGAGFPAPLTTLTVGRVWAYADIAAWATAGGRQIHPIISR